MKRPWQKSLPSHKTTPSEFAFAAMVDVFVLCGLGILLWVCLGFASGAKGAELVPGAVLVSRNQDERLNADIPGTMNHLAIVAKDGDVIESMVPVGVQKITMATYLSRPYETPLVLLPRDRQLGERAADKAATLVGTKFRKASSIFNRFGKQRIERGLNCVALVEVCYADAGKRLRRITKPDDIFKLNQLFEPARRLERPVTNALSGAGGDELSEADKQALREMTVKLRDLNKRIGVVAEKIHQRELQKQARFGWYTHRPSRSINNRGIFHEMLSRCPQWCLNQIRSMDRVTQCHEATHGVNHELSQHFGQMYGAFYVGDCRYVVLRAPNVTVGQVARYVPQEQRTPRYTMYLCGDRVARNCLSIADEFTCYANDAQCTKELGLQTDGGLKYANEFCGFADCMVRAVKELDTSYDLEPLTRFVDWQKQRVRRLNETAN